MIFLPCLFLMNYCSLVSSTLRPSIGNSIGIQEYCEDKIFQADCAEDEVIVMQHARYGRMKLGSCLRKNYDEGSCSFDVLDYFDRLCSGRRSCQVKVNRLMDDGIKPCPVDLRSYLEAKYICLKVIIPDPVTCQPGTNVIPTLPNGYLASVVTEASGCGGIDTPWLIRGLAGQRINITLIEFTAGNNNGFNQRPAPSRHSCVVLVVIKERTPGATTRTVCRDEVGTQPGYVSTFNEAEVRIVMKKTAHEQQSIFLVQYQVIGCPNLPFNGDVQRMTNQSVLARCYGSGITWRVDCVDGRWQGHYENCTEALQDASSSTAFFGTFLNIPQGVSIVIITAIAFMVGIIVLSIGYLIARRRSGRNRSLKQKPISTLSSSSKPTYYEVSLAGGQGRHDCCFKVPENTETKRLHGMVLPSQVHSGLQVYGGGPANESSSFLQAVLPPLPPPSSASMYMQSTPSSSRYTEHIYESPKATRREIANSPYYVGCDSEYFELEENGKHPITPV